MDWVVRNRMPFVYENLQLVFGDGRVLFVTCTAVPLYDHLHHMVGVTFGVRNISSQRQLERQVYEDKRLFEDAVKQRTAALEVENVALRRSLRSERRQKTMLKKSKEYAQKEIQGVPFSVESVQEAASL